MEGLENTGDKETSRGGGDEGWKDWRTQQTKNKKGV